VVTGPERRGARWLLWHLRVLAVAAAVAAAAQVLAGSVAS